MNLEKNKLNLERSKIIEENQDNFKEYIHSTKEIEKLKILGYGYTFDENRDTVWFINTKKSPNNPELPKEYLGVPIQYAQVIKSEFL
jgi:hypothetical protein